MISRNNGWLALFLAWSFAGYGCSNSTDSPTVQPNLASIQANIFDAKCSCHEIIVPPQAELDLTAKNSYNNLIDCKIQAASAKYEYRVVPGKPDSSFLVAKLTGILSPGEGARMPQDQDPLSDADIQAIKIWIQNGALDK